MANFYISILKRRRDSLEEVSAEGSLFFNHLLIISYIPLSQPDLDMLTALQNNEYKSGEPLTDKQIAHIMIALLMAGQHTSAATGSWAILHLGERPDLQ